MPVSTTEFTFSLSKIGLSASFAGLTFRKQMLHLLNAFRSTNGKIPPELNKIILYAVVMVSGTLYISGKSLGDYFNELRKFNQENLNITELNKQDKPFFYITFTPWPFVNKIKHSLILSTYFVDNGGLVPAKTDEIEVLKGIEVFKYWQEKTLQQHSQRSDNETDVPESPTLHTHHVENLFEKPPTEFTIDQTKNVENVFDILGSYVETLRTVSLKRQLSNAENEAIELEKNLSEFGSSLYSPGERHITSFFARSIIEAGSYFYELHWVIMGSIIICLLAILFNLYVFLSYSKPDLI